MSLKLGAMRCPSAPPHQLRTPLGPRAGSRRGSVRAGHRGDIVSPSRRTRVVRPPREGVACETVHVSPALGVSIVALALAASGGAYAATSGSSGSIVACVHHKGGGLYVAHKCVTHDKRLSWGVAGPTGASGRLGRRARMARADRADRRGIPAKPDSRGPPARSQASCRKASRCVATGRAGPARLGPPMSRSRSDSHSPRPRRSTTSTAACPYPPAAPVARASTRRLSRATCACTQTAFRATPSGPDAHRHRRRLGHAVHAELRNAKGFADGGTWAATSP